MTQHGKLGRPETERQAWCCTRECLHYVSGSRRVSCARTAFWLALDARGLYCCEQRRAFSIKMDKIHEPEEILPQVASVMYSSCVWENLSNTHIKHRHLSCRKCIWLSVKNGSDYLLLNSIWSLSATGPSILTLSTY